jgi:endonuclease/exonuclease/phosphatase (EEP) superfamily protein YafD
METTYYILLAFLVLVSLLPFFPNQHWTFRIWEFGRIQLLVLQVLLLIAGFLLLNPKTGLFWASTPALFLLAVNNLRVLLPYTPLFRRAIPATTQKHSNSVSVLSVNVYQFNTQYQRMIDSIRSVNPDILLTMESNQAWEDALTVLEKDYPYHKKIALENTYGMHFYSKLKAHDIKVNYFVADDMPSIEASLETDDHARFTLFGVHPAPPSPTEEANSKERDGELLSVARRVKEVHTPVLVVGDFNNVAWASSSILFRKTSELLDPRIGRGFVSTFHARYKLFRFPIDLFFHSTEIFVEDFRTLPDVGSDHLPLYCRFFINHSDTVQESEVEELDEEEEEEVDEMIEEGIEEDSDRPAVAKESNGIFFFQT